ncbi:MAG: hypothetical protein ACR2N1_13615 [Rubripirellula sp.]
MRKTSPHPHDTEACPPCKTYSQCSHHTDGSYQRTYVCQLEWTANRGKHRIDAPAKADKNREWIRFLRKLFGNFSRLDGKSNLASYEIDGRNRQKRVAVMGDYSDCQVNERLLSE